MKTNLVSILMIVLLVVTVLASSHDTAPVKQVEEVVDQIAKGETPPQSAMEAINNNDLAKAKLGQAGLSNVGVQGGKLTLDFGRIVAEQGTKITAEGSFPTLVVLGKIKVKDNGGAYEYFRLEGPSSAEFNTETYAGTKSPSPFVLATTSIKTDGGSVQIGGARGNLALKAKNLKLSEPHRLDQFKLR